MGVKPQTFYIAECDNCGKVWTNDVVCAAPDEVSILEYANDDDWQKMGDKLCCDKCIVYDDTQDEYVIDLSRKDKHVSNSRN